MGLPALGRMRRKTPRELEVRKSCENDRNRGTPIALNGCCLPQHAPANECSPEHVLLRLSRASVRMPTTPTRTAGLIRGTGRSPEPDGLTGRPACLARHELVLSVHPT